MVKHKRTLVLGLLVAIGLVTAIPTITNASTAVPQAIAMNEVKVQAQTKDSNGKYATEWQVYTDTVTGQKANIFVLDDTGKLAIGEKCINSKWYFFNPDTNGALVGNCWVYNGHVTDSLAVDYKEKLHYYNADGSMVTNWMKTEDSWVHFDAKGILNSGWTSIQSKWYYFHPTYGKMITGWTEIGKTWYYLNPGTGDMKTGWLKDSGKWYYLNSSGSMSTGWFKVDSKWYYADSSGTMQTGWVKNDDNWYFLRSDGSMMTNKFKIQGVIYTPDKSGKCTW